MNDEVIVELETSAKAVDNALAIESWANTGEMEATLSVDDSHMNLLYNLGIWCRLISQVRVTFPLRLAL